MRFARWLYTVPLRLRSLFLRKNVEHELDDELRDHLAQKQQLFIVLGLSPEEARRAALREFGGVELSKERCRDARATSALDHFAQDVRYALRSLRKSPGFAATAIVTLALGIGANAAIFSAVNAVLLRSLPLKNPDRLVFSVALREGFDPYGSSLLEYEAFRDRGHSYESIGLARQESFTLVRRGDPEQIVAAAVQNDYFETLGVTPILGRAFNNQDQAPGATPVALLGYGLWQRRFGSDPGIIGQNLDLDGRSFLIVGILPPGFDLPNAAELWVPLQTDIAALPLAERLKHGYEIVGRLRPGVTIAQADGEMKQIARELEREYPLDRSGWSVGIIPLRQELLNDVSGRIPKALVILAAAVGFLLLICCGNVASLLLARGVTREREIAVRRALGADWSRLVRQLLTESTVLSAIGAFAGILLAWLAIPLLRSLNPIQTLGYAGVLNDVRVDGRVLAFVVLVAAFTAVLCALVPLAKARSVNLLPLMNQGGRGSAGNSARKGLNILVAAQMGITVPLLIGGALLIRSFHQLQQIGLGFQPGHLLTLHLDLSPAKYSEFSRRATFVRQIIEGVDRVPGVVAAGITNNIPMTELISWDAVFAPQGHPPARPGDVPTTAHRVVTPDYLQTLGVTLLQGRLLDAHDTRDRAPVAVISEEFARQAWPGEDPLGKRVRRIQAGQTDVLWYTVVGVVKDVKEDRFNFRIARPVWYLPFEQNENSMPLDLVVRTNSNPAALTSSIVNAVHAVDPDQALSNVKTMDSHLAGVVVTERFSAVLMTTLAALGLVLAIVGLYGVTAYSVGRETREIGLRAALGATPQQIVGTVLQRSMRITFAGLGAGLFASFVLASPLASALYGVNPRDPIIFGSVACLLGTVALAASYIPARRATSIDPMQALRYE